VPPAGLLGPPPHPRVAGSRRPHSPAGRHRQGLQQAWEAKDIDALISLLDPGATVVADGGGLAGAQPIEGREQIARACVDLTDRAPGLTILERTVNGQPGLITQRDGVTAAVLAFDVAGDRIKHIWAVLNPQKLRPWATA
jgi:RNA polymerase sigma-70 factor (ECF subfamily)